MYIVRMFLQYHSCHTGNMDSESCLSLSSSLDLSSPARVELDHQVTRFEMTSITLGWKIFQSTCNISRILSHSPCEQNNVILNITTFDTKVTLSPENVYISNQLADFTISTFSYQSPEECPALMDSIRINGEYFNCKTIQERVVCSHANYRTIVVHGVASTHTLDKLHATEVIT